MTTRWALWRFGLTLVLAVFTGRLASAQTTAEVDKLDAEVLKLYQAGMYAETMRQAERALSLREAALGSEHPSVAASLYKLGILYRIHGLHDQAAPLFKRSLELREKALGPVDPDVAKSLNQLAEVYRFQGRASEAEPLLKRSQAILEAAVGADHPDVATTIRIRAVNYQIQGRYREAEALYERSLGMRTKMLGNSHRDVAEALNDLGGLYWLEKKFGKAERVLKQSLKIRESTLGSEHNDVAISLNTLATIYLSQNRLSEAEPLLHRSLSIFRTSLGSEHPNVSIALSSLGGLYRLRGEWERAAVYFKQAIAIQTRRADHGGGLALKGSADRPTAGDFVELIKISHLIARAGRGDKRSNWLEIFETAQWALTSEAAGSLAQMAARSAVGSPELADLVRERQDLISEWQGKDKLLIAARGEPPGRRNAAAEKALSDRLADIDIRLAAISDRFAGEFPDYAALSSPKPISVADVQASLRNDEALLLLLDTDARFKPLPEETFVWVVTKTDMRWVRSELGTAALSREVAAIRCGLDATAWYGAGLKRCTDLLNLPLNKAHKQGQPLPFDATRAHALYNSLLGQAAALIKGKHLLVVPSGALTTLPLQVLVTEPPKSEDLAAARWLVRDLAVTVLPSVASLKALRRTGKPSVAPKPMIGFGNPLLDGDQNHPRYGKFYKQQAELARAQTGCAPSQARRTAALRKVARSLRAAPPPGGRVNDLDQLRVQSPLPETADELCAVARSVGGSAADVLLGVRASETELKRLSESGELSKYRILHFATHGTLAGQLSGTSEPGLILTPPAAATPEDDGYLSGGEIASLKLDADWVILSACNTAGGAGEGDSAEALSGLARVFFYAGARALLVSHWEVDSDAAVKLVTGAIGALSKTPGLGRGEALRRSMLAVMSDTSRPTDWVPASHPSVWAPFVVVGEGGVAK
jgi:CHAT domain-containing protein/tetratricopeptide (TPR) repeat protein